MKTEIKIHLRKRGTQLLAALFCGALLAANMPQAMAKETGGAQSTSGNDVASEADGASDHEMASETEMVSNNDVVSPDGQESVETDGEAQALSDMDMAVAALDDAVPVADAEDICGEFRVSGTGYSFNNGVLTINNDANVTIKGTGNATTNRIEVASGANANITLENVNIDVSNTGNVYDTGLAAFKIADDSSGNVHVTLAGTNTLKSGYYCAGLQKNGFGIGKLTISGIGSLTATGGGEGAGIGSGFQKKCSNITISGGIVTAIGGVSGAGIGGGYPESGSGITISGGTVAAIGGEGGAGIGGGFVGSGSDIKISDGDVTATGGIAAAGIGGGGLGTGSSIVISGGNVTATGGNTNSSFGSGGAGIGGGYGGSGNIITISGGTVTATGGDKGAGIGGGGASAYGESHGMPPAGNHITISGGNVTATGGTDAQSIGSGDGASTGSTGITVGGSAYQPAGRGTTSTITAGRDGALIMEGQTGTVMGNFTLDQNLTIPADVTLTIGSGAALTVGAGVTLTIEGTINNAGALTNNGALANKGTFTNNGTVTNKGTLTNNGTVTNGGAIVNNGAFTDNGSLNGGGTFTDGSSGSSGGGASSGSGGSSGGGGGFYAPPSNQDQTRPTPEQIVPAPGSTPILGLIPGFMPWQSPIAPKTPEATEAQPPRQTQAAVTLTPEKPFIKGEGDKTDGDAARDEINGETEGTEITAAPENSGTDGQEAAETDAVASDTQSESAGKWGIVLALCFALPVAGVGGLMVWKKVGIRKMK